jgi:hypothetical protein
MAVVVRACNSPQYSGSGSGDVSSTWMLPLSTLPRYCSSTCNRAAVPPPVGSLSPVLAFIMTQPRLLTAHSSDQSATSWSLLFSLVSRSPCRFRSKVLVTNQYFCHRRPSPPHREKSDEIRFGLSRHLRMPSRLPN